MMRISVFLKNGVHEDIRNVAFIETTSVGIAVYPMDPAKLASPDPRNNGVTRRFRNEEILDTLIREEDLEDPSKFTQAYRAGAGF